MDNDVIKAICRAFHHKGFGILRFNFRGVGRSEGIYSGGEGELNDAATVVDWVQSSQKIAHRLWVAGFSFGAWIAMQLLMRRPEIEGFVIASPPAHAFDFSFLAPCPVSGQVLYGNKDSIVPKEPVDMFVEKLKSQRGIKIEYTIVDDADHSFNGQLDTFEDEIRNYLDTHLPDIEGHMDSQFRCN
jgi:alpha/beta superfamily hydrolase